MSEVPLTAVVDDDEAIREAVQSLIRAVGFRAEAFPSAEDSWHSGHLQDMACLIVDVRMPRISGLALQRQLTAVNCPIPLIFITAHGDAEMRAGVVSGRGGLFGQTVQRRGLAQGHSSRAAVVPGRRLRFTSLRHLATVRLD
jgi:CheY-like chemotaxis protein